MNYLNLCQNVLKKTFLFAAFLALYGQALTAQNNCDNLHCNALLQVSISENGHAIPEPDWFLEGGPCPNRTYTMYWRNSAGRQFILDTIFDNFPKKFGYIIKDNKTGNSCWGEVELKILPGCFDCDSIVHVDVPKNGYRLADPKMVFGTRYCSGRRYVMHRWDAQGMLVPLDTIFHFYPTQFYYQVTDWITNEKCSGMIKLNIIDCNRPFSPDWKASHKTLSCLGSVDPGSTGFPVPSHARVELDTSSGTYIIYGWDVCGSVELIYSDAVFHGNCNDNYDMKIYRRWQATDVAGQTHVLVDTVSTTRADINRIAVLPNYDGINKPVFDCNDNWERLHSGAPSPKETGFPDVGSCGQFIAYNYADQVFNTGGGNCDDSKKVLRTWTIINWCTNDVRKFDQIIKVICNDDKVVPVAVCEIKLTYTFKVNERSVRIWASDLDDGSYDNCALAGFSFDRDNLIKYRDFDLSDTGKTFAVYMYVHDLAGNYTACATEICIRGTGGSGVVGNFGGRFAGPASKRLPFSVGDVSFYATDNQNTNYPLSQCLIPANQPDMDYALCVSNPIQTPFMIDPELADKTKGMQVTAFDAVMILRHILGIDPLNDPYERISADVNRNQTITMLDVVELMEYILGISNDGPQWGFFNDDPTNILPFESISWSSLPEYKANIVAVPIGDINNSIFNFGGGKSETRGGSDLVLTIDDKNIVAGEYYDLWLSTKSAVSIKALQIGELFDPNAIEFVHMNSPFLNGDYNVLGNEWRYAYIEPQLQNVDLDGEMLKIRVKALRSGKLSDFWMNRTVGIDDFVVDDKTQVRNILIEWNSTTAIDNIDQSSVYVLAQPNPFSNATEVLISSENAELVNIELHDMSGKKTWEKQLKLSAGSENKLSLDRTVFPSAGVYYLRVTSNDMHKVMKLIAL